MILFKNCQWRALLRRIIYLISIYITTEIPYQAGVIVISCYIPINYVLGRLHCEERVRLQRFILRI